MELFKTEDEFLTVTSEAADVRFHDSGLGVKNVAKISAITQPRKNAIVFKCETLSACCLLLFNNTLQKMYSCTRTVQF